MNLERYDRLTSVVIVGVAMIQMFFIYFQKYVRNIQEPAGNVVEVWHPFAKEVLAGGQLYLAHWDNKPPLFQFVNLFAEFTGSYYLTFYGLLGLVNGLGVLLLWKVVEKYTTSGIGLIAAFLWLSMLPTVSTQIDPRQFALLFILTSLTVDSPFLAGLSIATGGLFSQFTAFAIPGVLLIRLGTSHDFDDATSSLNHIAVFGIGAGLMVLSTYLSVALLWSTEAMITAIEYTIFDSGSYVDQYNERGLSLFGDPIAWVYKEYRLLSERYLEMGGFLIGTLAILQGGARIDRTVGYGFVGIAIGLLLQTIVRTAPIYGVLWIPFTLVLAAIGFDWLLQDTSSFPSSHTSD